MGMYLTIAALIVAGLFFVGMILIDAYSKETYYKSWEKNNLYLELTEQLKLETLSAGPVFSGTDSEDRYTAELSFEQGMFKFCYRKNDIELCELHHRSIEMLEEQVTEKSKFVLSDFNKKAA
ncbi:hypothetical protein ACMXYW_13785 [Neptuniibacter sp. QD48_55]|uniref:hypothetical protein n=1 Tax=Neptuniibacter sp. QD48_55 TaxID=3398212 RepID=UPI0039F59078